MLQHDFMERLSAFWDKVDSGEPDACWEWQGYTDDRGYGYFSIDSHNSVRAHQIAAAMTGTDIEDKQVNHECDNPACVNTAHLYIGEQYENVADMVLRGQHEAPDGEENGKSVLTAEDVRKIRNSNEKHAVLADRYGTTPQNIGAVKRRETWKGVEP